jgi:hypothetical protein
LSSASTSSSSSSDTKSNDNENIQTNESTKQNDSEEINSDVSQIKNTTNISDISANRQHLKQQQQNDQQKQSSILINGKRYYRNYIYSILKQKYSYLKGLSFNSQIILEKFNHSKLFNCVHFLLISSLYI